MKTQKMILMKAVLLLLIFSFSACSPGSNSSASDDEIVQDNEDVQITKADNNTVSDNSADIDTATAPDIDQTMTVDKDSISETDNSTPEIDTTINPDIDQIIIVDQDTFSDDASGDDSDINSSCAEQPKCAATDGARCYYIATDGDDTADGTIDDPFISFTAAISKAAPGDFIYVRGGSYGKGNAMASAVKRINGSGPTSCEPGQTLTGGICYEDVYAMISLLDFSGWASSSPAYTVSNGTKQNPITVRNFPCEKPVLDMRNYSKLSVNISHKSHWIIEGFEMIGGQVNISSTSNSSNHKQSHDITIRENNIHDIVIEGGGNPGIVRINRGDVGGPYNIYVLNNELHDIYDEDYPGNWASVPDEQHFAAVTTLSRETYLGYEGGGTGLIHIKNNRIYNCPQAFFFKNPMYGPIEISGNIIHHVGSIGTLGSSNVLMTHNLVYEVDTGWWKAGNSEYRNDPDMLGISGQKATITFNTFVGLNSLISPRNGTGHTIKNNIFFGMNGRVAGAGWETPAYIKKSIKYSDNSALEDSILKEISSNFNCFISPYSDFQHLVRQMPGGVEHWGSAKAASVFGWDIDSKFPIESDPAKIFIDPSGLDFRLIDSTLCPSKGYYDPNWKN